MFQSEQEKRYRTFDGQPVHVDYTQSLLKDPVIQGGFMVSAFTAAVIAPSSLTRAATTFVCGVGGTIMPILFSRWLIARDMRTQFNGHANTHAIDTKPEHGTPQANDAITQVSRDFYTFANKRLRMSALLCFLASEPMTRVIGTMTSLSDKMQGNDLIMATFSMAFLITQWRLMDLHKSVENNQARIVRIPAPEKC